MYSDTGNTTSLVLGFPIRTPSDQRSVGSSPRHIAASHVLHRPLMPRHPPCALKHLQSTKPLNKEKSHHNKPPHTQTPHPKVKGLHVCQLDARNHYPRIKHHTPPPSGATTPPPETNRADPPTPPTDPQRDQTGMHSSRGPVVSKPNSVSSEFFRPQRFSRRVSTFAMCTRPPPTTGERPSNESSRSPNSHSRGRA
jgi:hypothetical protein